MRQQLGVSTRHGSDVILKQILEGGMPQLPMLGLGTVRDYEKPTKLI